MAWIKSPWTGCLGTMSLLMLLAMPTIPAAADFDWRNWMDNNNAFDWQRSLNDFDNDWNNRNGYGYGSGYNDNNNPFDFGKTLDDLNNKFKGGSDYGSGYNDNNNPFDFGKTLDDTRNNIHKYLDEANRISKAWDQLRNSLPSLPTNQQPIKDRASELMNTAEETWSEIPEPARNFLIEHTQGSLPTPVPFIDEYGNKSVRIMVVAVSPLEGKVYAYEPSKEAVVTMLTNDVVEYVTDGTVSVDEVKTLEVKKVGAEQYEIEIEAQVSLFGIIPIPMEGKIVVDTSEDNIDGDVKVVSVEKPWWSTLTS